MRDESLARCWPGLCLPEPIDAGICSFLHVIKCGSRWHGTFPHGVIYHRMACGCRLVLEGPLFGHYFDKVEVSNFEVASDAFSTFKVHMLVPQCSPQQSALQSWPDQCLLLQDLLTKHKAMVAAYLISHYEEVGGGASMAAVRCDARDS